MSAPAWFIAGWLSASTLIFLGNLIWWLLTRHKGVWLVEASALSTMSRAEQRAIEAFLSANSAERYRPVYSPADLERAAKRRQVQQ
jgi:hypothetical protein